MATLYLLIESPKRDTLFSPCANFALFSTCRHSPFAPTLRQVRNEPKQTKPHKLMKNSNFLASIQAKRQKVQADRAKAESWYDANPLKASVLSGTAFELRELDRIESDYLAQVQLIADRAAYAALPWYKKLFTTQP